MTKLIFIDLAKRDNKPITQLGLMKRGVYGVFHNVSVKYMQKYVNEFCYRLNHRDNNEVFASLVKFAVA